MFQLFLTQGGGILGPIERLLGWILNLIYEFLAIFGIENVGLAIIFFTMIVKTLMLPLTIRQQKFTKLSSKMNPEISKIQEKYKDKKDEASMQRQQIELQAVYDKYGSNPASGCLPLLVTLPIMMGLYRVIYKIPAYIKPIKDLYEKIANSMTGIDGWAQILAEYGEELGVKAGNFAEYASDGILSLNHAVDIMSKFTAETWQSIAGDFPSIASTIESTANEIIRINSIPGGLNLLESPGFAFPGILIPILAASLQFIQTKQTVTSTGSADTAASSMNTMNKVMPIMSGVFCTMLPTGVGLYWVSNSLFTIIQNIFINKHMETVDLDDIIEKNKEKQKKKQAKIGINQGQSFSDIAKTSTKSLDSEADDINSSTDKKDNNTSYSAGSISDYANYIKNKDKDKGDK